MKFEDCESVSTEVSINIPHVRQTSNWDCGIASVQMVLKFFGCNTDNFRSICNKVGFSKSIWTIDLAILLHYYNISCTFKTVTLGVDEGFQNKRYYNSDFQKEQERVNEQFKVADCLGIGVSRDSISINDIVQHLCHNSSPIILLVDSRFLECEYCKKSFLSACCLKMISNEYAGHFVVISGCDMQQQLIFYKNPSLNEEVCGCTFSAMDRARRSYGTDEDIVFTYLTNPGGEVTLMQARLDIDKPLWGQDTFVGRFKYFAWMTNPMNLFHSTKELNKAKDLVDKYREGKEPPDTTRQQILRAKKLYESAFHPDTGELQNVFGRMCFQVPGGLFVTTGMLAFQGSYFAIFGWQWYNQTFNALVNYTNRNAKTEISTSQMLIAYLAAVTAGLGASFGTKRALAPYTGPITKYVPFVAASTANAVNVPLMRMNEIREGIKVFDEEGNTVTVSKIAAIKGVSQVVSSRVGIAAPGMLITPIIMHWLYKRMPIFKGRYFGIVDPLTQGIIVGCFLTFMVPTGCGLFPQRCSIKDSTLRRFENARYQEVLDSGRTVPPRMYFNKGL